MPRKALVHMGSIVEMNLTASIPMYSAREIDMDALESASVRATLKAMREELLRQGVPEDELNQQGERATSRRVETREITVDKPVKL